MARLPARELVGIYVEIKKQKKKKKKKKKNINNTRLWQPLEFL